LGSCIDALLRLSGSGGWSIELDSSTAMSNWRKAQALGVISEAVEWRLTTDADVRDIDLTVVDPSDEDHELVPVVPIAFDRGWRWFSKPLLFDNGSIHVEILLPSGASDPAVFHLSRAVCERFVSKNIGDRVRLVGLIEPGNDVGSFELAWQWRQGGIPKRACLRTTVLSTKMDVQQDFPRMVRAIREAFPARLKLDLLRQTRWGLMSSDGAPTIQSWLAVFQSLEVELLATVERVMRRPRWKLGERNEWRRLERIQRLPSYREEEIARAVDHPQRLHRIECPVIDPDQLENRFVKHVALDIRDELRRVSAVLKTRKGVSDIFAQWMDERVIRWESLCRHPFWRSIGPFKGLRQESLTLQRDMAYAGIRRGWDLLRSGLEVVLTGATRGGIRSIDDLYELWCLVQMDRALQELGWARHKEEWSFGRGDWDDFQRIGGRATVAARLSYRNKEYTGETVSLIYQPHITAQPSTETCWEGVLATPVDQQPDLVLRHRKPAGDVATWIFDAKYRVETEFGKIRVAPSDAIHQVQRYRDALLVQTTSFQVNHDSDSFFEKKVSLVREAWGAFVLFPGSAENGWQIHPQASAIDLVNIGAIPLRCTDPVDGYEVLKEFLEEKFAARRLGTGFDNATPGARGFVRA
jgi:hypothetical protein